MDYEYTAEAVRDAVGTHLYQVENQLFTALSGLARYRRITFAEFIANALDRPHGDCRKALERAFDAHTAGSWLIHYLEVDDAGFLLEGNRYPLPADEEGLS